MYIVYVVNTKSDLNYSKLYQLYDNGIYPFFQLCRQFATLPTLAMILHKRYVVVILISWIYTYKKKVFDYIYVEINMNYRQSYKEA